MTTTTTAKDYGASALELETLRRLVTAQVPAVRFGGFTPSGAANGEYSFRLPNGLSAWVRSPTAPKGRQRARHPGHWLFRLTALMSHLVVGYRFTPRLRLQVQFGTARQLEYRGTATTRGRAPRPDSRCTAQHLALRRRGALRRAGFETAGRHHVVRARSVGANQLGLVDGREAREQFRMPAQPAADAGEHGDRMLARRGRARD